jgi:exodeoxyribonuclease VII large subunit
MNATPPAQSDRLIYSVSSLLQEARDCLELSFPLLWVEGEISNFSRPASGHWYFTLKDSGAQVRCAMFKGRNRLVDLQPDQGLQVLVRGRIGLYVARGEFQMVVEHMEEAGAGALQRAFEVLKTKLQAEGLFSAEHKLALPTAPRRIGVITSATGAAIRDILSVLKRRYPLGEVIIYPVPVQGDAAAPAIVRALEGAAFRQECDVLLLARGGGSLEDLWAFNEEVVARAIHACPIPTVSGVGHEVDFTIADFVADQRAPTPSAAAELASPDQSAWQQRLRNSMAQLNRLQHSQLQQATQRQRWLQHRLLQQHPGRRLEQNMQRLDELEQRLLRSHSATVNQQSHRLERLDHRLQAASPARRIQQDQQQGQLLAQRLHAAMQKMLQTQGQALAVAARALDSLSPLKTLERGYAVATTTQGELLTQAQQIQKGDALRLRLHQAEVNCTVDSVKQA